MPPKFKVGDDVERINSLIPPPDVQEGKITLIIPDRHGIEHLTEYVVDFGNGWVGVFYQTQLRLATDSSSDSD
jgi:hypothetical protein